MAEHASDYLIVGGGLAGASAIEGIRERDPKRSIAIIGAEEHLPYDRPPLSEGWAVVRQMFLRSDDRDGALRVTLADPFNGRCPCQPSADNQVFTRVFCHG